jgi:two-component system sensor histidine kinase VanS
LENSKIYRKIIAVVAASSLTVLFLRYLVRGSAGDWIVAFLQKNFHFSPREAQNIYQSLIRNNLDYIIIAAIAVCVIMLSVILISYSRNQAAKNAKLAEQRKNDLITYLAHDIKTPLTSVIGYLSLLNESPALPDEQKARYIGIALDKAYRLESLVNQFFELTQYNLQTISLSPRELDLYYLLLQLTDEVFPQLAAHHKTATIHAAEDLTVRGDPDKLARAFNNLLKNAICYGEDNSNIDITAKLNGPTVRIEFSNAGSIPPDKLASLFEKFYRLDEARSGNTGGAGLGLAIAREIISLHGGKIYAESENGCTVFTVELPAHGILKKI